MTTSATNLSTQPGVYPTTTNAFPWLASEEAHGDRQASEALLFTFNADLGFFEARLLGLLRATGARVTVVADAGVWDPDTRAVRHAGRSYHVGLCTTRAAFHPKFMLVVGPKRALATIGSGNLTMGGWQYNSETLTVLTGDMDGMPLAFADILALLDSLDGASSLDPIVGAAIQRAHKDLGRLITAAPTIDTGHRVHASWDAPLITRLPKSPVRELYLSAAFHDPASAAVHQILDRLTPQHVEITVQPGWTHLDPRALQRVLNEYAQAQNATFRVLQDPTSIGEPGARYRHGKLIEWVTLTGERYALTGSPNLSLRAFTADTTSGGNHEIAVTGPIPEPLFPGGTPTSLDQIPVLTEADDSENTASAGDVPVVRVVSARSHATQTEVHLNRTTSADVAIEVSLHSDSPDHWRPLGSISQARSVHTFNAATPAGSRIRSLWPDPLTGLPSPTPPVYVTDVDRVLTRSLPNKRASRTHRAVAADLFGEDIALLDSLQSDLARFAQDISNARQPTQARDPLPHDPEHAEQSRGMDRAEPWLWLQDDTVRRYGPGLASWLLALPHLHSAGGATPEVPWLDKINDDTEVGLETDDDDAATEEVAETEPLASHDTLTDHTSDNDRIKSARQRWAVKATAIATDVPMLSRVFILRLTLAFWTAGNWRDDDNEPFTVVRDLIGTLDATDDPAEELRDRLGAITAVALTVMRQRVDLTTQRQRADIFREAARLARPLLSSLSEEAIDAYTTGLRTAHGHALSAAQVAQVVADLPQTDALGWLTTLMESRGHSVTRPASNQIHIHGTFPTPEQVALDAMGHVEEASPVAVWASNENSDWTLVVWNQPDLVTVNHRKGLSKWRHQRLSLMGPAASANALKQGGPGDLPNVLRPKHIPTNAARQVLKLAGIDEPALPPTVLQSGAN